MIDEDGGPLIPAARPSTVPRVFNDDGGMGAPSAVGLDDSGWPRPRHAPTAMARYRAAPDEQIIYPVPGLGGAGVATFAMAIEVGAKVVWRFGTTAVESMSGLEQRAGRLARPQQRYEFATLLTDAQQRSILSLLAGSAAGAPLFLLALPYEDLTVVSSTATTITVNSLALCDWAQPGQRMVAVSPAGVVGSAVVQNAGGAVIAVDTDLSAIATRGARVMPAMGVYLDPEQAFSRRRVKLGGWSLTAAAERFGFGPSNTVGTGATVTTYTDPVTSDAIPVWDIGNAIDNAAQPLFTGAELVDFGSRVSTVSSYTVPAWGRALRIVAGGGRARASWQYLKEFLDTIGGPRKRFLLPTGRPDLVPVGTAASGTLTISTADGTDYVGGWFPSLAHRRLKLVLASGAVAYRQVSSCADGGATQDLTLDSVLVGAIARVELLEQVRLASDEVTATWGGAGFECAMAARVVQG